MIEKIFLPISLDMDYAILCANCSHGEEDHEHDEYDGWRCSEKDCTCKNWKAKTSATGHVQYDPEELRRHTITDEQRTLHSSQ